MLPTASLQSRSQLVTQEISAGQAIAYSGEIAAPGTQPHGVSAMPASGSPAIITIDVAGYTQAIAGGPIAIGSGVAVGENGRFVSATTNVFGRSVSVATSDGDPFLLHITREGASGGGAGGAMSSRPFSTQLEFSGSPIVYDQHSITGPLSFALAPSPIEGASVILKLIAGGIPAHTPTFPGSQLVGSAGWVNVAGTLNIVSYIYLGSTAYYSINQPVPAAVSPPPVNPAVEAFVNFARRTPDLLLSGSTYSTAGAAGHFTTYATSDIRLAGDGYYVIGPASTNSTIVGLSVASTLQSHGAWPYRVTRYGPTGGCVFNYAGAVRGDFPTGATDEIRFLRSGITISVQSKSAAATTWTTRYTYPETFSGLLWLNFSLSSDGGATSSSFDNPRALGAS